MKPVLDQFDRKPPVETTLEDSRTTPRPAIPRTTPSLMIGKYQTQEYIIDIAGESVRILGPKYPHSLLAGPQSQERFKEDGFVPYWATPWPAATMLTETIIQSDVSKSEPILEIGAGLGIAAVALTLAGYRILATDGDYDALEFIRASARWNGVQLYGVEWMDWREPLPRTFTTIIGSDVIYEKRHHQPIAALLASRLRANGQALISTAIRQAAETFPDALGTLGFSVESLDAQAAAIPSYDAIDGRIFKGKVYRIFRKVGETDPG